MKDEYGTKAVYLCQNKLQYSSIYEYTVHDERGGHLLCFRPQFSPSGAERFAKFNGLTILKSHELLELHKKYFGD